LVTNPLTVLLRHLRRSALLLEGENHTDAQLLKRFVAVGDRTALEALIVRHAPMVWGVCRWNLPRHVEPDDAFQATFLVLIRKAASIRRPELVGNWLYGVALQTARKARQVAAKRGVRELPLEVMPEPQAAPQEDEFGPELLAGLEQELSRLPQKYRMAIVLSHLEGRSRAEVARLLGVKEGTVASRLDRGRVLLAKRLARRGLTVSATTLAALGSQHAAPGAVLAALLDNVLACAGFPAAGDAVGGPLISSRVARLTRKVLQAMAVKKLRNAVVLLAILAPAAAAVPLAYHALQRLANGLDEPDPEKYGSAAGAEQFAKALIPKDRPSPAVYLFRPAHDFAAVMDRETHLWTVTRDVRMENDAQPMSEMECKWVLRYNSSSRTYDVVSVPSLPWNRRGRWEGWRPASLDGLEKWRKHDFKPPAPVRTGATISTCILVTDNQAALQAYIEEFSRSHSPPPPGHGPALLPDGRFTTDKLSATEIGFSGGVTVHADAWRLEFGRHSRLPDLERIYDIRVDIPGGFDDLFRFLDHVATERRIPEVGCYGGAHARRTAAPFIIISRGGGGPVPDYFGGGGDFVVWEIDMKDQRGPRLAIDFIGPCASGSLRINSSFQPVEPELDR
jgi:RNA polymerase sigma factor (sigma-70 family)